MPKRIILKISSVVRVTLHHTATKTNLHLYFKLALLSKTSTLSYREKTC